MSKQIFAAILCLGAGFPLISSRPAHAELSNTLQIGDAKLVLNGAGARTKYLMQMYVAGLYLTEPSGEPAAIIAADAPMVIRMEITSGLVTEEKLVESLNEGFENATGGKSDQLREEINLFRKCLAGKIVKGDVIDLVYIPAEGLIVAKNGKKQGLVQGLAFKKALFGIWLSDNPADKELKRAMLVAKRGGGQALRQ